MNLIQLKRFVKSNKITRGFADKLYLTLTGQLKEKRHCTNGDAPYYIIRPSKSKVLTVDQQLVENYSADTGLLVEDYKSAKGANHYKSRPDYLASVVMLSKCDFFLGALAGGSIGAFNHK